MILPNAAKNDIAHLYVESYNRYSGDLLLDFVNIDEFNYYDSMGNYSDQQQRYSDYFRASMIYIKNFHAERKIRTGCIIEISIRVLMDIRNKYILKNENLSQSESSPALVQLIIEDEESIRHFNSNIIKIHNNIPDTFNTGLDLEIANQINHTWRGAPCGLENLKKPFNVIVWDVGQGSTNCITDGSNLTIFDFGCNMLATKKEQYAILKSHESFIKNHYRSSLIISHWDADHYNLLCLADKDFLTKLCCAFVPDGALTVTSKNVLYRLTKYCSYVIIIPAAPKTSKRGQNILVPIYSGNNYTAFTGEKCSDKNKSGIALHVFGSKDSVLLTADHTNAQVWNEMYGDYISRRLQNLNIVVPHHGGYCGALHIPAALKTAKKAVISVGKNRYKHPYQYVTDKYTAAKFDVFRTDWERADIVIDVR